MRIIDIISKKRDKKALTCAEIEFFVQAYVEEQITDYQASALLMAIYLNGLSLEETVTLTQAMINCGETYQLKEGLPYVDKHSTGGVGDKVSLILAPLLASCGAYVPMLSGRSLGHTGGTLDKLDSISGYRTLLSKEEFLNGLYSDGYAMSAQSNTLVPADRKIYALRDATATVESIPLITASILSKKVAEGTKSLCIDLKCGSGAFMKTIEEAEKLGHSLLQVGKGLGLSVKVTFSNMSVPLGSYVGNYLEVEESLSELKKDSQSDLMQLTKHLGAQMLLQAGLAHGFEQAYQLCQTNLDNGKALKHFWRNIERQGGDVQKLETQLTLRRARFHIKIKAWQTGYISKMDSFQIGLANIALGGGRNKKEDKLDYEAGIFFLKKTGEAVKSGEELAVLWSNDSQKLQTAETLMLKRVYQISDAPPLLEPLILKELE
ncbi:UNVERIFIED_CONTAM: hypothetical protein PYX00_010854 [Menopon gallinae]|uniref:Thymidine phosphorylase n=1 Tax=Menopon gallinae TaxID=328185 RepID=A0AAW2H6H6_9NEOP